MDVNGQPISSRGFPNLDPMYPNPFALANSGDSVQSVMLRPYQNNPWVYVACRAYARNLAPLPRWLADKNDPSRFAKDHPLYSAWRDPNPLMNSLQLWETIVLNLLLPSTRGPGGQCFLVLTDIAGEPVDILSGQIPDQIWPYSDEVMTPLTNGNQFIGWKLTVNGQVITTFAPHQVVRLRLLNPGQPLKGLSPFNSVRQSVELDARATQFDLKSMENGGALAGVLHTDSPLNDQTVKEIREQWQRNFGGAINAGKTPLLTHGLEYQEVSRSQQEMQFAELQDRNRDKVLAVYGVPKFEAGIYEDINYATAEVARRHFWGAVLKPFDESIWCDLNDNWIRFIDKGRWVGLSDYSNVEPLQESYKDKAEIMKTLFGIGVPVKESARLLKVPLQLDQYDWTDSVQVSSSLTDISMLNENNAARNQGAKNGTITPLPPEDSPGGDVPNAEPIAQPKSIKKEVSSRQSKWDHYVRTMFDPAEKPMKKELVKYFVEQRNFMQDKVDAWESANRAAPQGATRGQVPNAGELLPNHIERKSQDDKLKEILDPLYKKAADLAVESAQQELGQLVKWNEKNPFVSHFKRIRLEQIPEVNTTTFKKAGEVIAEIISAGVEAHLTVQEMAKELKKGIFDIYQMRISNSQTIARTETAIISSSTRQQVFKVEGIKQHEWLSAHDDKTRETHLEEDGNIVDLGDPFPVTGLQYPSDPSGEPEEVINCRCVALAVIKENGNEE